MGKVIYALVDPRDDATLRYIGQSNDPGERLKAHLANGTSMAMRAWLKRLQEAGIEPSVKELAECGDDEADALERSLIAKALREGHPVFNEQGRPKKALKTVNVGEDVHTRFRDFVYRRHGKLRGVLNEEAEAALLAYVEANDG